MYVIKLLDSETTADILIELDEDNREKVLKITELLTYDEDTAGGLMAKELVKVYGK